MVDLKNIEKALDAKILEVDSRGIAPQGTYDYYIQKAFAALAIELTENQDSTEASFEMNSKLIDWRICELRMNLREYFGVSEITFANGVKSYLENYFGSLSEDKEFAGVH